MTTMLRLTPRQRQELYSDFVDASFVDMRRDGITPEAQMLNDELRAGKTVTITPTLVEWVMHYKDRMSDSDSRNIFLLYARLLNKLSALAPDVCKTAQANIAKEYAEFLQRLAAGDDGDDSQDDDQSSTLDTAL